MRRWATCICLFIVTLLFASCIISSGGGTEGEGLTGVLLDPQGSPCIGALVRIYPDTGTGVTLAKTPIITENSFDSTRTDFNGRFDFPRVKSGRYNLECTVKKNSDTQTVFVPQIQCNGKQDLGSNTLRAPGNILIRAQSEAGAFLDNVKCDIPGSPFSSTSDRSGTCEIAVSPGVFKIRLQKDGYLSAVSTELQVLSGKTLNAGVLILTSVPPFGQHFPLHSSTVALWTFNSLTSFTDSSSNHFILSGGNFTLEPSPFGASIGFDGTGGAVSIPNDAKLTVGGTGKLTYEARIYLDEYPAVGNFNSESSLMGMYEGLKMQIWSDGRIQAGAQKINSLGTGYWDAPVSQPGVIPLHRWVDVAVAIDQANGQYYAYIDGQPVQLSGTANADLFLISTSDFTVGKDNVDGQYFKGKVDEIRISNTLILGPGLPVTP